MAEEVKSQVVAMWKTHFQLTLDSLPSGAYLILKVTLPTYDTVFLFPMCTREGKSQKGRGKDWHSGAGECATHNSMP